MIGARIGKTNEMRLKRHARSRLIILIDTIVDDEMKRMNKKQTITMIALANVRSRRARITSSRRRRHEKSLNQRNARRPFKSQWEIEIFVCSINPKFVSGQGETLDDKIFDIVIIIKRTCPRAPVAIEINPKS